MMSSEAPARSKVTWGFTVSLDGFITGPDHDMSFMETLPRMDGDVVAKLAEPVGVIISGRRGYDAARAQAAACGLYLDRPLDPADRCVSPSDFGFHNALREPSGRLRFIDFEYAGWDDPAKLVCDFFCQPAVPAPAGAFDRFAAAVGEGFAEPNPRPTSW